MRKGFTFLLGIFVCAAAVQVSALAASRQIDAAAGPTTIVPLPYAASSGMGFLSAAQIGQEIAEAKRLLRSQPTMKGLGPRASVTLATLDPETSQINLLSVPKDSFLVKGADFLASTQLGRTVRLHVISANGVNTAVTVTDTVTGRSLFPLVAEYPIVKKGALSETAYYTSAHPALLVPEIISAGKSYVTTMLDQAARHLAENGVIISPDIVNVAQHLVIVEHTDHKRFLNEDRGTLFPEILSLYALNQGDTFRYSISSAGAGGMIQMIPKTYEAIRQHHPGVDLESDFVSGMRDHANALEAMLLYIDDTWNYLQRSAEVQGALRDGIANKNELLAAGYNSNPYRLPSYLARGGAEWRTLIPAETQMYLAIYGSVDSNVQFDGQPPQETVDDESSTPSQFEAAVAERSTARLVSWLSKKLLSSGSVFSQVLP
jgi:hypothetical protein